jgi:hypothetical protein
MIVKRALVATILIFGSRPMSAATSDAHLRQLIVERRWEEGLAFCEDLPRGEGRRPDLNQLKPPHYAELAALCAAVASGGNEPYRADWWWFTATAMDVPTAMTVLNEMRAQGLLTQLAAPRTLACGPKTKCNSGDEHMVTLADGTTAEGQPATVSDRPRPPNWMFPPFLRAPRTEIVVELVVDSQGAARQPLVVSAKAPPLYGFQALWLFRQWRFAPATVEGKPVATAFQVTLTATHG